MKSWVTHNYRHYWLITRLLERDFNTINDLEGLLVNYSVPSPPIKRDRLIHYLGYKITSSLSSYIPEYLLINFPRVLRVTIPNYSETSTHISTLYLFMLFMIFYIHTLHCHNNNILNCRIYMNKFLIGNNPLLTIYLIY